MRINAAQNFEAFFFFKCNNIAMAVDRMKFCDSKWSLMLCYFVGGRGRERGFEEI